MRQKEKHQIIVACAFVILAVVLAFLGVKQVKKNVNYVQTEAVIEDKNSRESENKVYKDTGKYVDIGGRRYEYTEIKGTFKDSKDLKRYNVEMNKYYDYFYSYKDENGQVFQGEIRNTNTKLGDTFLVLYNPDNPQEHLIENKKSDVIYVFAAAVLCALFGFVIFVKR